MNEGCDIEMPHVNALHVITIASLTRDFASVLAGEK